MSGEDIVVREIEDIGSIKRVQFARAYRRRDGQGGITEAVAFAGYEVAWGNQEFTAVVAMVSRVPSVSSRNLTTGVLCASCPQNTSVINLLVM